MQTIEGIANQLYTRVDIPEAYRMDVKSFIERPFFVESVEFPQTAARYSVLPLQASALPGDIIRSNISLLNAMKLASYYRADLVLNVSMAGTITHAGCLLVGIMPPIPAPFNSTSHVDLINTLLSGPHCFLYANEATSVNISVPWYCNADMATLDLEKRSETYLPSVDIVPINGNYATLVMMVLNPLQPSTGSTNKVTVIVEACFKRLEVSVPTPRFVTWESEGLLDDLSSIGTGLLNQAAGGLKTATGDAIDCVRQWIRSWTGLHNPNNPRIAERLIVTERNFPNVVDSQQYFEKLDPNTMYDRIVKQPIFGTDIDEMRIPHIISKKQMIGTITVSASDPVGKLLWSRPISPYQGGMNKTKPIIANNIELLHHLSRGWRGNLKLHIISVMNNKQQVKLRVLNMYNPSVKASTAFPNYNSIANAPSHLLEFTQGGQEQIVSLPYLCRNDITPCSRDMEFEAMFHGLYYIYVAQPLVISDGSPTSVEFNIFLSGDEDLTFYGYATEIGKTTGFFDFGPLSEENMQSSNNVTTQNVSSDQSVTGSDEKLKKMVSNFQKKYNGNPVQNNNASKNIKKDNNQQTFKAQSASRVRSSISRWLRVEFNNFCDTMTCSNLEYVVESLEVMNEPQKQKDDDMKKDTVVDLNHIDRLKPNVDVRPYIRRMYKHFGGAVSLTQAGYYQTSFDLASILGENGANRSSFSHTPITALSNMYYGKTCGFKIKVRTTALANNAIGALPTYMLYAKYLPPNMHYNRDTNTVLGSPPNASIRIDDGPFTTQVDGVFPLTFQMTPITSSEYLGTNLYEFVIPDVTYYKFIGGPSKLNAGNLLSSLSIIDYGRLVLYIYNPSSRDVDLGLEIYVGLTDESRLGYHCIAPRIEVPIYTEPGIETEFVKTLYRGNPTSSGYPPLATLNPYLYKGGFLS